MKFFKLNLVIKCFYMFISIIFMLSSCNQPSSKETQGQLSSGHTQNQASSQTSGNKVINEFIQLEKLPISFKESPKRIFSVNHPSMGDADIRLIWVNDKGNKKKLFFKTNGRNFELNEIYNKQFNNDINGVGIETYEEISIFSNEDFTIIISSSPESASLVYWYCEVKIFIKSSSEPIFKKDYHAEEID
jgi:hypothetical protein